MAVYYVYSGATGSNNGSSWANAFTTLVTAFATEVAGDTLYVAHDHAESAAGNITLSSSGSVSNPTKVVCVSRAGSVPPVSADRRATATISSPTNNNISIDGSTIYDGIIFTAGAGSTSSATLIIGGQPCSLRFDNCSLRIGITTSAGGSRIMFAGSSSAFGGCYVELNNTTLSFAGDQGVNLGGIVKWRNTSSALLGTIPSTVFQPQSQKGSLLECIGVDLSAAGAGKSLVDVSIHSQGFQVRFIDCKINASVNKVNSTVASQGTTTVELIRSGAAGVNYTVHRTVYAGKLDEETTIVRTGGASDGTTPIAWKIVTAAGSSYAFPFEAPPIAIWNDTIGSAKTATVEGIWGGGAVPNDDDIWLDLEYLGDASSPQGSFVNDGKADLLATAAGQTPSSATWGGSTTKFKLNVSFTAQQKGWIYARVKCAKASSTFYIDPLITLT